MLLRLVLLLTLVPIAELYVLVKLTQLWGSFWITLGVILGTGVLGAALARMEGLRVWRSMQQQMAAGQLPADGLVDGVLILVAAALLLTPGLITDVAGLCLLVPFGRRAVREAVKRRLRGHVAPFGMDARGPGGFGPIHKEPPPGFPPVEE